MASLLQQDTAAGGRGTALRGEPGHELVHAGWWSPHTLGCVLVPHTRPPHAPPALDCPRHPVPAQPQHPAPRPQDAEHLPHQERHHQGVSACPPLASPPEQCSPFALAGGRPGHRAGARVHHGPRHNGARCLRVRRGRTVPATRTHPSQHMAPPVDGGHPILHGPGAFLPRGRWCAAGVSRTRTAGHSHCVRGARRTTTSPMSGPLGAASTSWPPFGQPSTQRTSPRSCSKCFRARWASGGARPTPSPPPVSKALFQSSPKAVRPAA
jgi:hypothetical protein